MEEDTNDESIIVNCDGSLSSLASPTLNKLSEQKSSETVQENVNTDPLISNLGDCSHSLGEKPSCGLKEPWTSSVCNGESSNSGSDIPPCVEFIEGDNSSDKEIKAHRGEKEEPHIARLCTGESSCKGTDVPHCVESTKEDSRRPNSNNHYLNKGKYEWATSTVSTEPEECFQRRERRVAVRKVAVSWAIKMFGCRC
uniref:Uncharacterized protein n=1 Tax=Arundo donax TaxID=35708 RepID=A0A0A9GA38_ARUDO